MAFSMRKSGLILEDLVGYNIKNSIRKLTIK
jgi:hypothetical protein